MGMWCIDKGIWLSVIVLAVLSQIYCQTALKEIDGTFTMITLEWNETYSDTSSHQYIDFVNTTADQIENIFSKDKEGDSMVLEITFSNLREPNVTADVNIKLNTTLSDVQIGAIFGNWIHLHSYENEPFTVKDVLGNSSTTFSSNVESSVQYIQSSATLETHLTSGLVTSITEYLSSSAAEEHPVSQSHAPQELQSSSGRNEAHVVSISDNNIELSTPALLHSSMHVSSTPGVEIFTSLIESHMPITSSSSGVSQPMVVSSEQPETQPSSQEVLMQTSTQTGMHSSSSRMHESMAVSTEHPEIQPSSKEILMQSLSETGRYSSSLISETSSNIVTGQASASHSEQYAHVTTSVNEVLTTSSVMTEMQMSSGKPSDHQLLPSSSMTDENVSMSTKEILPQSISEEQAFEPSTRVVDNVVNTSQLDASPSYTTSMMMATESLGHAQEFSSIPVQTERSSSEEMLTVTSSSVDVHILPKDESSSDIIGPMLTSSHAVSSSIADVVPSETIDQNLKTSIADYSSVINTFSSLSYGELMGTSSSHGELIGTSSDLQASSSRIPVSVYETDLHAASSKSDSSSMHEFSSSIDNVKLSSSSLAEYTETQGAEISISSSMRMDILSPTSSVALPIVHYSSSSKVIDASEFGTANLPDYSSTTVVASDLETSLKMPMESSAEVSSSAIMTSEENKSTKILESESQTLKLSMDQTVEGASSTAMLLESHLLQTTSSLIEGISHTASSLYESATHAQVTSYQMDSYSEITTEIPSVVGESMSAETKSSSVQQTPLPSSTPFNIDISSESSATSVDVMVPMSTQSYDIQSSLVHIPVESEHVSSQLSSSNESQTSIMGYSSHSVNFVSTPSLDVVLPSTEEVLPELSIESSKMTPIMEMSSLVQSSGNYMTEQPDSSLGSVGESTSFTMHTQSQTESLEVYSSYSPQSDSMFSEGVTTSVVVDSFVSASFEEPVTSMTHSDGFIKPSATHDISSSKLDLSLESSDMLQISSEILESTEASMLESLVSSNGDIMPSQTGVSEMISSEETGRMPSATDVMTESLSASISSSMTEDSSTLLRTSTMSPSIEILSSEPVSSISHESSETQLMTGIVSSEASYSGISSYRIESSSSVVVPLPELSQMSTDTMSTTIVPSSPDLEMTSTDLMESESEIESSSSSIFIPVDTSMDIFSSTVASSSLSEQIPPIDESVISTFSSTSLAASGMVTTEVMLSESSPTTITESSESLGSADVSSLPIMSSHDSMLVSSEIQTSSDVLMSSSSLMNVPSDGTSLSSVSTMSMEMSAADSSYLLRSTATEALSEMPTSMYVAMSSSEFMSSSLELSTDTSQISVMDSSSGLMMPAESSSSEISMSEMESSSSMMSAEISMVTSSTLSSSMDTSSLVLLPTSTGLMMPTESSSSEIRMSEMESSSSMMSSEISMVTSSALSSSMDTSSLVLLPTSTEIMQSSSVSSSDMDISSSFIALPASSESEVTSSSISSSYLPSSSMSSMMTSAPEMVASSSILQESSSIATSSLLELDSSSLMPTSIYQSSTFITTSLIMSSPGMSSESITSSSSMLPSTSVELPTLSSVLMSSQIESSTSSSTPIMPASSSIVSSSSVVMSTSVDITPSSSSAVTESSSVVVTLPVEESLQGQFRITNDTIWKESLGDKNSQEYKSLAQDLQTLLTNLFKGSSLKSSFLEIGNDMTFSKGSVIVDYTVTFRNVVPAENVTKAFKESVAGSNNLLGSYPIDTTSVVHGDEISQTTPQPIMTTEAAETTSRAQLLPHWAIAVLVCGGVLLIFLLFMMFVLCSRRHTRQKYRMPEDPDDIGYRRSWASSNSGSGEFAYENKLEISDSFDSRKLPLAEGSEIALNDSSPRHKSNDPQKTTTL